MGNWEMRNKKWENGKWEMRSVKWEIAYGKWEMGK
jgi:hypothetical protein